MDEMRKEVFKRDEEIARIKDGSSCAPDSSIAQLYASDNTISSSVSSGVSVSAGTYSTSFTTTDSNNVSISNDFDCSTHMDIPTPEGYDPHDTLGSSH